MAKANTTPDPWERQEGETPRAYEAFCAYRDMGPNRSINKTAQQLTKNRTTIAEWSTKYEWVKRVAAWDAEQDRIARQEQAEEIRKMRRRHSDVATAMIVKAARALNRMKEEDIKPSDISRFIEVASKLERLSRGDTSEVIEERDGGPATPAVTFYIPSNNRDQKETEEETP